MFLVDGLKLCGFVFVLINIDILVLLLMIFFVNL